MHIYRVYLKSFSLTLLLTIIVNSGSAESAFSLPILNEIISIETNSNGFTEVARFPSISDDGSIIAFNIDIPIIGTNVYVRDRNSNTTKLVSKSLSGVVGNSSSYHSKISGNGQFITFYSKASDLVPNDTNDVGDIFVYNIATQSIELVSVSSTGEQANGASYSGKAISNNGRYIVFSSEASNLVGNDTNLTWDVFLHDRTTKLTTLVSKSSTGGQGNDGSFYPSISDDGNLITFQSYSTNLESNDINNAGDIFVHDVSSGKTELVSRSSSQAQSNVNSIRPKISGNGQSIVFLNSSLDLIGGDSNDNENIYVRDLSNNTTELIAIANELRFNSFNDPSITDITDDGTRIVFSAENQLLTDVSYTKDVFLFNRSTQTTRLVSRTNLEAGDRDSDDPAISGNGEFITFSSEANNLVHPGSREIYLQQKLRIPNQVGLSCDIRPFEETFIFNWSINEAVTNFHFILESVNEPNSPIINSFGTSITDSYFQTTTPLPDDVYRWRVRAQNEAGWGEWTEFCTAAIGEAPVAPETPSITCKTYTSDQTPIINWAQSTFASDYHLILENSDNPNPPIVNTYNSNYILNNYTVDSNLPFGNYRWRVRSGNEKGYSDWSEFCHFKIGPSLNNKVYLPIVLR